jgi:hypothetical protein
MNKIKISNKKRKKGLKRTKIKISNKNREKYIKKELQLKRKKKGESLQYPQLYLAQLQLID